MTIQTVIYLSVLFFLSEFLLMILKRAKKENTKVKKDRRSLIIFWITIPLSLTAGFYLANYHSWDRINHIFFILGLLLFLTGMAMRWTAILQLKREFTVDVSITEGHQLKTDGIYKKIRHPAYLGLLLTCTGLALAMNSILSFFVVVIPLCLAILYRIRTEESILISEFGDQYREYMTHTRKLFPF